ncbi:unnamed protein product [Sympodiomycopsis kandeliae]
MSHTHPNSTSYYSSVASQQLQQSHLQQRGGYSQNQIPSQLHQHHQMHQQPSQSYSAQSFGASGNPMTYNGHHGAGNSSNGLPVYQSHSGTSSGISFLTEPQQSSHQQQLGSNGNNGYNAHASYLPSSSYQPSHGQSSLDAQFHQHHHPSHHQQPQQQQQVLHHQQTHIGGFENDGYSHHGSYSHQQNGQLAGTSSNSPLDDQHAQFSNGMRPKRRQVKNACVNCQKACKKCDEGRPCSRCIKYGLTDTCMNSMRKERKRGIKRGPYKRRATTESSGHTASNVAAARSSHNSSSNNHHIHYHSGQENAAGNGTYGSLHRSATLPSSYSTGASSSTSPLVNGNGALFPRDQSRSAADPDTMAHSKLNGPVSNTQNNSNWADVKGGWAGLASSSSTSSANVDAHSSRLPQLNFQQQQQQHEQPTPQAQYSSSYLSLDSHHDRSASAPLNSVLSSSSSSYPVSGNGGRLALSSSPLYTSNTLPSPSAGQQFRPLPSGGAPSSSSTGGGSSSNHSYATLPFSSLHHQRYQSDSGSTGLYSSGSSSMATSAGSNASSANFSSPRTPLSLDLNGGNGGNLASPPLPGNMYLKSPLAGSYVHTVSNSAAQPSQQPLQQQTLQQPQGNAVTAPRNFALQMPPMPRGRGGGSADMFNSVNTPMVKMGNAATGLSSRAVL